MEKKQMKGIVMRGRVHVIANDAGGVYHIDENMNITVTLRQIECWFQGPELVKRVKEMPYTTSYEYLRENNCLPGNLYIAYTIQPIREEDPEYGLWWEQDKVVRTPAGQAIYTYTYYDPTSYQDEGELQQEIDDLQQLGISIEEIMYF